MLDKLSDSDRKRIAQENADAAEKARKQRPTRDGDRMDNMPVPVSGRAGAAVSAALSQLGDPYVWGADGPSSYDCSGLMMYAWGKAGVSLSHSSKAQAGEGRRVSKDQLMPGDLVFYYSPISHVAMYIGNGRIVHAPPAGQVGRDRPDGRDALQHRGPPGLTCVLDILIGSGARPPEPIRFTIIRVP